MNRGRVWRFATYNCFNLYEHHHGPDLARYQQVAEVIAGLDADVVAVQEIRTGYPLHAGMLLARLADASGMTAEVTPGWAGEAGGEEPRYAVAAGAHTFHTGLMWRPDAGIEPVPTTFQAWGAGTFFHALALLTLRLDGTAVGFGSYHAAPFGRRERADQAARVLAAVTRPPQPMLLGGDMNTVSAARLPGPDGTPVWYDPDPYQAGWFGDLVYQCDWRYQPDGTRVWWADRRPSDVLISGGLHDAAAAVGAPWQATTGHHPADAFGQRAHRRIDHVYASGDMRDRLVGHEVVDTPLARQASDHLPVVVSFTA